MVEKNGIYFVVDELMADLASAQALNVAELWNCDVHIFIERRDRLAAVREVEHPRVVYHYDVLTNYLPQNLPSTQQWPSIVYLRLFAPLFLNDCHRLIYLDADVLCIKADDSIWSVDIPCGLGAVSNTFTLHRSPNKVKLNRDEWLASIGVKSGKYFNSGFLLIDPDKWADYDFADVLPEYFERFPDAASFDQDFLNSYFDGQWTEIGPRFNMQAKIIPLGYTEIVDPVFIHFCKGDKPWHGPQTGWRSDTDPRYFHVYSRMLTKAGFTPEDYFRPSRLSFARKIKYGLRGWLSSRGVRFSRAQEITREWEQNSSWFWVMMNDHLRNGAFADETRSSIQKTDITPVFDGRYAKCNRSDIPVAMKDSRSIST